MKEDIRAGGDIEYETIPGRPVNKKAEQSRKTRKELEDAFIRIYADKPIEKISIKEITDLAGYNRATFYLYYRDIYDILEQIENRLLSIARKNIPHVAEVFAKPEGDIRIFITIFYDFYEKNKQVFSVLILRDTRLIDQIKSLAVEGLIKKAKENGSMQESDMVRMKYIVEYQLSGVIGAFKLWMKNNDSLSFEDMTKIIFETSLSGYFKEVRKYVK